MEQASCRVLVVEDERPVANVLAKQLGSSGYAVEMVHDAARAIDALSRAHYHAALVDMMLPGGMGHEVLAHATQLDDPPALLMMSGHAGVSDVVNAMRVGAADFLQKPFGGEELVTRLRRALDASAERRKLRAFEAKERRSVAPAAVSSGAMHRALLMADKVAATPSSSALLIGESGVGKEIIASRIHNASSRRGGPFVRVNLAAISETMLEAELFGNVKGAFTDAKSARAGYLASADGGTILLDEIGEFRIENQAKLLRVLEERRFFPVGSDRERAINVRVIAATNRDPKQMIEAGLLRSDLFYRLGSVIHIPPLRERLDEVLSLADHFLTMFCAEFGRPVCRLAPATKTALLRYTWPGNVRQLRNAIERAIMLTEGEEIPPGAFDLPPVYTDLLTGMRLSAVPATLDMRTPAVPAAPRLPVFGPSAGGLAGPLAGSLAGPGLVAGPGAPASAGGLGGSAPDSASRPEGPHRLHDVRERALADLERTQIVGALEACKGSRSKAAVHLGMSRSTLYEKLKRYRIT